MSLHTYPLGLTVVIREDLPTKEEGLRGQFAFRAEICVGRHGTGLTARAAIPQSWRYDVEEQVHRELLNELQAEFAERLGAVLKEGSTQK